MAIDRQLWWGEDEWWREPQYTAPFADRLSPDEISRSVRRVAKVFDAEWATASQGHPAWYWLRMKGSLPLGYLFGLGDDLLSLEGCLRLPSAEHDLRQASHYDSTRLELGLAARFRRQGYAVELRPSLPTGKEADFVVRRGPETVFFEVKWFAEPTGNWARNELSHSLISGIGQLFEGQHRHLSFDVQVSPSMADLIGADQAIDAAVAWGVTDAVVSGIKEHLATGATSFEFEIPGVAYVSVGEPSERLGGVACPMPAPESELRRILRKLIQGAFDQLHPEAPGIVVIQSHAILDENQAKIVVGSLLRLLGEPGRNVSAVVFLPIYSALPPCQPLFRPFFVANELASTPPEQLTVINHVLG